MLVICSLLALTLAQPPAASEQGGRVAGRVVLQGANAPVSGARVILVSTSRPVGPMDPPAQTTSDQDGRFSFDRVSPGTYRVDAQKAGFAPPDDAVRNQAFYDYVIERWVRQGMIVSSILKR